MVFLQCILCVYIRLSIISLPKQYDGKPALYNLLEGIYAHMKFKDFVWNPTMVVKSMLLLEHILCDHYTGCLKKNQNH
jgi:hypothetical protein